MSDNRPQGRPPEHQLDYELPDTVSAEEPIALKAMADETRLLILDLVMERSASVTELATALGKPKSTVAHHVGVLEEAGLLAVVRTRRVRAIEERFYGRTGRTILLGTDTLKEAVPMLDQAGREVDLDSDVPPKFTIRHARIPLEDADEFCARLWELAEEFTRLPRGGDTVYGFVAGVYPTQHPKLPRESEDG